MTTVTRYDYSAFTATKTDEGFLVDSPIVARIGIQEYKRADGTIRRELRLPENVFNADSLASMRGKPVTVDHPKSGRVTSKDAHRVTVGTILSSGRQDGDNVRLDLIIHSPDAIGNRRELSLGYSCVVDETPGEHPQFGKYDAVQGPATANHLSIVPSARAGKVARLNLDGNEEFINQQEQQTMTVKVKLDNGIEYDAAPEVSVELNKLRADASDAKTKLDAANAAKDVLQAKVDAQKDDLVKAKAQGRADAMARLELEATATKFKIDHKAKSDRDVKELVIKAVRKDADLKDKSDVYVDAAFDMAVEVAPAANMASQRQAVNTKTDSAVSTSKTAYAEMMANLGKPKEATK